MIWCSIPLACGSGGGGGDGDGVILQRRHCQGRFAIQFCTKQVRRFGNCAVVLFYPYIFKAGFATSVYLHTERSDVVKRLLSSCCGVVLLLVHF